MKITTKIKENRKRLKITQQELSKKTNITQQAISKYENNERIPNIENIIKIANAMNLTIDELIEYEKIHEEYSNKLDKMKTKKD